MIDGHPAEAVALQSRAGGPTTYGEPCASRSRGCAAASSRLGLEPGDRRAILRGQQPVLRRVVPRRARCRVRGRAAQPHEPRARAHPRAGRGRRPLRIAGPSAQGALDRHRPPPRSRRSSTRGREPGRSTCFGAVLLDDLLDLAPRRRSWTAPRTTSPSSSSRAAPPASPKAAMLTHGNLLGEPAASARTTRGGPRRAGRRRLRGAAVLPHLRAQRGARPHAHGRRPGADRGAVRPAVRDREHRQPPGHR